MPHKPKPKRRTKRTWIYVQQPIEYGIAPHSCGKGDAQWSEWKGHLWCKHCEVDFIPDHNGVFDGPIAGDIATALGMDFSRIDLKTKKVMRDRP